MSSSPQQSEETSGQMDNLAEGVQNILKLSDSQKGDAPSDENAEESIQTTLDPPARQSDNDVNNGDSEEAGSPSGENNDQSSASTSGASSTQPAEPDTIIGASANSLVASSTGYQTSQSTGATSKSGTWKFSPEDLDIILGPMVPKTRLQVIIKKSGGVQYRSEVYTEFSKEKEKNDHAYGKFCETYRTYPREACKLKCPPTAKKKKKCPICRKRDAPHAEDHFIYCLKKEEEEIRKIERLVCIMNFSPCNICAGSLIELANYIDAKRMDSTNCKIDIVYAYEYYNDIKFHQVPGTRTQITDWRKLAFVKWNEGKLEGVEWWTDVEDHENLEKEWLEFEKKMKSKGKYV